MTTKTFLKILTYIVVGVVCFALAWWFRGCKCGDTQIITDSTTVIKTDTIRVRDSIKPKPYKTIKIDSAAIYNAISPRIDGSDCCNDYNVLRTEYDNLAQDYVQLQIQCLSKNFYTWTPRNDSLYAKIDVSCERNEVQLLSADIRALRSFSQTNISNKFVNARTRFILGGGTSYLIGKGISLHVSLGFITGRHLAVTAGYDPLQKSVMATGYYVFGKIK